MLLLASARCAKLSPDLFLMPYATLRRSCESGIHLPCGFCLLLSCLMNIKWNLLQRGSQLFYFSDFSARVSSVLRLKKCFVTDPNFQSLCPNHLAVCLFFFSFRNFSPDCHMPLTLSDIPAFESLFAIFPCGTTVSTSSGSEPPSFSEVWLPLQGWLPWSRPVK